VKIAAVSCVKLQQVDPQPAWQALAAEQPDVLLLLGDNIYLDHDRIRTPDSLSAELKRLYAAQLAEANFAALLADVRNRGGRVEAIYDDHDFLGNNRCGGDDPALAVAARAEFVAAFAPPMTGVDVYRSFRAGPVDVVVLDERFYRHKPSHSPPQDRDAVLGAAQWIWLEGVVARSSGPFLLVASGTTVHRWGDESWEQYPAAFERLRALIGRRSGALVVSGDIHRNTMYDDSGIVEIVTSGLARLGMVFHARRENWGLLTFDAQGMRVQLHSLQQSGRFDFRIELADWRLP
jgi:alkaline phosphatase D